MEKYGKFKNYLGEEVDLDDPGLIMPGAAWGELHRECVMELGYALVYFRYLNPEIGWNDQVIRVEELCHEMYRNEHFEPRFIDDEVTKAAGRNPDPQFWRSFLYRIIDEIENLC